VVLRRLVVLGGYNPQSGILSSSEVYDEASDTWTANTPLSMPRYKHTTSLIGMAMTLVVSGTSTQDSTQTELFTLPQHVDGP
jgi:galactose oxidase-like protein